jgi:hypothetical protein
MSKADSLEDTAQRPVEPIPPREQALVRALEHASRRGAVTSWARLGDGGPRRWRIETPPAVQSPKRPLTTAEAELLAIGLAAAFVAADRHRTDMQVDLAAGCAGEGGHG